MLKKIAMGCLLAAVWSWGVFAQEAAFFLCSKEIKRQLVKKHHMPWDWPRLAIKFNDRQIGQVGGFATIIAAEEPPALAEVVRQFELGARDIDFIEGSFEPMLEIALKLLRERNSMPAVRALRHQKLLETQLLKAEAKEIALHHYFGDTVPINQRSLKNYFKLLKMQLGISNQLNTTLGNMFQTEAADDIGWDAAYSFRSSARLESLWRSEHYSISTQKRTHHIMQAIISDSLVPMQFRNFIADIWAYQTYCADHPHFPSLTCAYVNELDRFLDNPQYH